MNTARKNNFSRIYMLVVAVGLCMLFYYLSGNFNVSDYKYNDFVKDLESGNVQEFSIIQNKEVPTGKLAIRLKDKTNQTVFVPDVNKVVEDVKEINERTGVNVEPYIPDVKKDSIFLTTILPMIFLQPLSLL